MKTRVASSPTAVVGASHAEAGGPSAPVVASNDWIMFPPSLTDQLPVAGAAWSARDGGHGARR